jgi:putative transposase
VTTDSWQKRAVFQATALAEILCQRIIICRDSGTYLLHEFVVMPNHLHLLLTPGESTTLEKAIQLIKGGSSHEIHKCREHKMEIWQPGFHEWTVRNSKDFATKVEYIRMNPVRARLVMKPEEWAHGSASGKYNLDPMPQGLKPLD